MDKELIKILIIVFLTVTYFANLFLMFVYNPLEILIVNLIIMAFVIVLPLMFKFIDWLND